MEQGSPRGFEEYVTLRQEMLETHSFCRNILYWTVLAVIAALVWHLGTESASRVSGHGLAVLLFAGLITSVAAYSLGMMHVHRLGSFIAVFWEPRRPERVLRWHRFNRRAREVVPELRHANAISHAPAVMYAGAAAVVLVAIEWLGSPAAPQVRIVMRGLFVIAFLFPFVSIWAARRVRRRFEDAWQRISAEPSLQDAIDARYEPAGRSATGVRG